MKENIFEKIYSDTSVMLPDNSELNDMLEAEIAKENPDIELIDELISAIAENDNLIIPDVDVESGLFNIKRKAGINRRKGFFKRKLSAIVAAACAILALSNIYTYSAYGNNLYTLVTKKNHFISFKFLDSDKTDKNKFCYDDYGVKKFFEELGMKVEAPMYYPDNFVITEKHPDEFILTLSDGTGQVDISFYTTNMLSVHGVKPDSSVISVNGHEATYICDENADWLIYKFDDITAVYDFINLSDKEINKIISSIK